MPQATLPVSIRLLEKFLLLPEGVKIIGAQWEMQSCFLRLLLESAAFPETPEDGHLLSIALTHGWEIDPACEHHKLTATLHVPPHGFAEGFDL